MSPLPPSLPAQTRAFVPHCREHLRFKETARLTLHQRCRKSPSDPPACQAFSSWPFPTPQFPCLQTHRHTSHGGAVQGGSHRHGDATGRNRSPNLTLSRDPSATAGDVWSQLPCRYTHKGLKQRGVPHFQPGRQNTGMLPSPGPQHLSEPLAAPERIPSSGLSLLLLSG